MLIVPLSAQGMYPTLIIIVCAVDKSLYEKANEDNVPNLNTSIVFNNAPPSRLRGTLSELVSATSASAYHDAVTEDVGRLSESMKDSEHGTGEGVLPTAVSVVDITL